MWIFDWLLEMIPGGLPEGSFSAKAYPKTFAWRERYREACHAAKGKLGHRRVIEGHEAAKRIIGSEFHEQNLVVDENDFIGVKKGAEVAVWPIDDHSGRKTRQVGELVGLTHQEAVVEKKTQNGETRVRVHLPRWNYRVEPADARNGVATHHHSVHQHGGDEGLGAEHYEERH
jgi:hypothetical protein